MVTSVKALSSWRRSRVRREPVPVPTEVEATDAIFLVLRRVRAPLLWLVGVFTVAVFGLAATPGVNESGEYVRITVFEAFYVMSYTATTIGFGEIPREFTTEQRMWVTFMMYATVIGWAYAIGTLTAVFRDEGFTSALTMQRFGRQVRRISQPFYIVAGYGQTGRSVCRRLDQVGIQFVVVDESKRRIDLLNASQLSDVPKIVADVHDPAVLGLCGLGHSDCVGVLALTDDDEANLAVVETVALLQPSVPVIARVADHRVEERMAAFHPTAVINPIDRFGNYLTLSLQHPAVYQLVVWLTSPRGGERPERGPKVTQGRWTVVAEGEFEREVAKDLEDAGYDVWLADPSDDDIDVGQSVGCVVATLKDSVNLALAAQIRAEHPEVLLCVRQVDISARPVITAFAPHIRFIPTDIVARECLGRTIAPLMWSFIEHALEQEDDWAEAFMEVLDTRCGHRAPTPSVVRITAAEAPAIVHWLSHDEFTVGDLVRDHDDRDRELPVVVMSVVHDDEIQHDPDPQTPLRVGDEVLIVTGPGGASLLHETLFNDADAEYVATGNQVPQTWIWRRLTRSRRVAASTSGTGD